MLKLRRLASVGGIEKFRLYWVVVSKVYLLRLYQFSYQKVLFVILIHAILKVLKGFETVGVLKWQMLDIFELVR